MGLSPYQNEIILIQLDTEDQSFEFTPDKTFINKFDVFKRILVTPIDILLSQKIFTAFNRKKPKGRDFFDIMFLIGKTRPNEEFLFQKLNISSGQEILDHILNNSTKINFEELEKDLAPFIFKAGDEKRISGFKEYIESLSLDYFMCIDEYLKTQSFNYDHEEGMYYNNDKKIIIQKQWAKQNPKKAETESLLTNLRPKIFVNSFNTAQHSHLVEKYRLS